MVRPAFHDRIRARLAVPVAGLLAALAALALGCSFGEGPDDEGGRRNRPGLQAVTRLKSSVLGSRPKRAAVPAADERCDFGHPCTTPLNLEGRIRSGHLMVGGNGGPPGVPVRIVEGYDTSYHGPETGRGGTLLFNLGSSTDLGGTYFEPSSYPPDELAKVHRLEFLFDYLDATFQVPADSRSPLAGRTFTIRTVYVDTGASQDLSVGQGAIHMGDKLIRAEGEGAFRWCTASGCAPGPRPASPLRAAFADSTHLIAYPHYFTVGINLKVPMPFTRAEAERGYWRFTVDWDLTRAVKMATQDWARLETEADLVEAFDLLSGHGGPGGIGVDVSLTKTALDTTDSGSP